MAKPCRIQGICEAGIVADATASDGILRCNGADAAADRNWFATFTLPQNEKSVLRQLDLRKVESFLPTYETIRVWRNRQRKRVTLPLFPTYLFVRIHRAER